MVKKVREEDKIIVSNKCAICHGEPLDLEIEYLKEQLEQKNK